jgi:H+/Cl- antiporter ClcA
MFSLKKALFKYKDLFLLSFIAILIGIIVGSIDTLFGKVLLEITRIRNSHVYFLIPFLPLAGILIAFTYSKIGKNSNKGMSLIFSAAFKEDDIIPKRLVPLAITSTWVTHLFGGSAGREGVAVQIGGTVGHSIGRRLSIKNSSKILLITGMSAGFAGLFQTPLAAIFFSMEVLTVGTVEYSALLPCVIAAYVAKFTSQALGLKEAGIHLDVFIDFNGYFILKIALLGILFGIIGGFFAYLFSLTKKFLLNHITNPMLRIFLVGCIVSAAILLLHKGRYAGFGTNLISAAFHHEKIYGYDWILKLILTILTLSAGFQGGEVTPLFSIGASLGAVISPIFGLPMEFAAALGYVAVFGSATNTILAPIFIGAEVFGYDYIPYFFIVSAIAYVFNGNRSIYSAQKM